MKFLLACLLWFPLTATAISYGQCNLGFNWSSTDCTQYGLCDGTITLWVPGGTPPYTFGIDGGTLVTQNVNDTVYTFTGLCTGTYDLFVWDQTMTPCSCVGCGGSGTPTVTITEPAPGLTASADLEFPTCVQDIFSGELEVIFSGDAPTFEISLDGGNNWQPASSPFIQSPWTCQMAPPTIMLRDATMQVISVPTNIVNPNGCQAAPLASVTLQNDCGGQCQGSIGISISPAEWDANSPYLVTIDSPLGYLAFNSPIFSPSDTVWATNLCADSGYSFWVSNSNGCIYAAPIPITITNNSMPSAPTITTSGPTTFCDGQSVVLTSSQGSGNEWSTGETTSSITVSATGLFSATYTDINGCSATSDTMDITVNTLPTVDGGNDLVLCEGDTATLIGTGANSYSWDNSVVDGAPFVPGVGTTLYSVTGADGNGCENADQVSISVNPLPGVSAGSDLSLCEGDTAILTGTGADTYVWDNSVVNNIPFTPPTGTTTYQVIGTDSVSSCSNMDYVTIEIFALPSVSMNSMDTVCIYDTPFTLQSGTPAGGVYSGTGVTGSEFDPSIAGIGNFTITYDYIDTNGCMNSASETITVDGCANLSELSNSPIILYPNPTQDVLNISYNGRFDYVLADLHGKVIVSGEGEQHEELSVDILDDGMYLILVSVNGDKFSYRFVKH